VTTPAPILFRTVAGSTALKPGLYKVALPGWSQAQADRLEKGWTMTIGDFEARDTRRFSLGYIWQGFKGGGFTVRFPRSNYINPNTGADVTSTSAAAYFPRKGYSPTTHIFWCLLFVKTVQDGAQAQHLVSQLLGKLDISPSLPTGGGPVIYRYQAPTAQPAPQPVATVPAPKPAAPSLPAPAPSVSLPKTTAPTTTAPKPITITPPTPSVSIGGSAPKPAVTPRPAPSVTATVGIAATPAKAKADNTGALVAGGLSLVALLVFGVG
jgi:hypothetical protein